MSIEAYVDNMVFAHEMSLQSIYYYVPICTLKSGWCRYCTRYEQWLKDGTVAYRDQYHSKHWEKIAEQINKVLLYYVPVLWLEMTRCTRIVDKLSRAMPGIIP